MVAGASRSHAEVIETSSGGRRPAARIVDAPVCGRRHPSTGGRQSRWCTQHRADQIGLDGVSLRRPRTSCQEIGL